MSTCPTDDQILVEALGKIYDIAFENGRNYQARVIWEAVAKGDFTNFEDLKRYLQDVLGRKPANDKHR